MPRLKVDDDELDIEELEEAEYEESDYEPYSGPQPPKGTILYGYVKKIWWTYNSNDVRMFVVIFEATDESGKYKGLGVWDRITLSTAAKFRWQPFLDAMGITLQDIKKKMIVERDDENQGRPVTKIGSFVIGDEEKAAIRIITKKERYNDEWETKVDKWLPWEDPHDDDEEDEDFDEDDIEEEEEEEPAPKRRATATGKKETARKPAAKAKSRRAPEPEPEEDEDDEEEDEYEDDEDDEEEETPARPTRRAASGSVTRKSAAPKRSASKAVVEEEEDDSGDDEDEPAPKRSARPAGRGTAARPAKPVARSSRTGSATAAPRGKVAKASSRKGRASAGYDDDPPF